MLIVLDVILFWLLINEWMKYDQMMLTKYSDTFIYFCMRALQLYNMDHKKHLLD